MAIFFKWVMRSLIRNRPGMNPSPADKSLRDHHPNPSRKRTKKALVANNTYVLTYGVFGVH